MKKSLVLFIGLFILVSMNCCFADVGISDESKYGLALDYGTNPDYPGKIIIDGVFIHEEESDYVVTVLYSQGDWLRLDTMGLQESKHLFLVIQTVT